MSLTTYEQIVNSEVIVILRSFFPSHPNGGQSDVLKAVFLFFKVSLTVFPFVLLLLVVLFPLPVQPVLSQAGS